MTLFFRLKDFFFKYKRQMAFYDISNDKTEFITSDLWMH